MLSRLKASALFKGISPVESELILSGFRSCSFNKGSALFRGGDYVDSLYIINKGMVRLTYLTHDGDKMILRILRQGDLLGEFILAGSKSYFSAIAVTDVMASRISKDHFVSLLGSVPLLSVNFMNILSRSLVKVELDFARFGHSWSLKRLAEVLNDLSDEHGQTTPRGLEIPFRITHGELADMVGVSRVTVTNQMKRLKREGVLSLRNHRYVVHKSKLLEFLQI